jgi:hypothetical protein
MVAAFEYPQVDVPELEALLAASRAAPTPKADAPRVRVWPNNTLTRNGNYCEECGFEYRWREMLAYFVPADAPPWPPAGDLCPRCLVAELASGEAVLVNPGELERLARRRSAEPSRP